MAIATEVRPGLGALSGALAGLAEKLRPSVVGVRAAGHGGGAGVIWQADGLIITNAHVVPRDRAEVVLADERVLPARLVARDPALDLAALRLEAGAARELPLVPAAVGDSTALRVGQLVFAMGHPLGVPHAVAMGIIGSVGGPPLVPPNTGGGWRGATRLPDVVQADLTLYPGNSGGPLVDAQGRVIGINSMVVPPRLALAVPSATVARFLAPGSRARLGVRTQLVALPPPLAWRLGLGQERALMVVEVVAGQPAAAAGLLPGDILLAADGRPLEGPTALASYLDARDGVPVRLRVLRGGAVRDVAVTPRSER